MNTGGQPATSKARTTKASVAAPAAGLDRRIQWPLRRGGAVAARLVGLLAMAAWPEWLPARPVVGIPDHPDVRAARDLGAGLAPPGASELRFASAFLASDSV